MKVLAIVQARMESTRMPGKVLMDLCGEPVLKCIYDRVVKSKCIDGIAIATSSNSADDMIEVFCKNHNIGYYRGSQDNVLQRFYECATVYGAQTIVRLTGDNALVDSTIIDDGICHFNNNDNDYEYYCNGLPLGMAVEIFSYQALEKAYREAEDFECLEHVTPYFYRNENLFRSERVRTNSYDTVNIDFFNRIGVKPSQLRWTMDTPTDFHLISNIYNCFKDKDMANVSYLDILGQYKTHPEWIECNSDILQVQISYKGEE